MYNNNGLTMICSAFRKICLSFPKWLIKVCCNSKILSKLSSFPDNCCSVIFCKLKTLRMGLTT